MGCPPLVLVFVGLLASRSVGTRQVLSCAVFIVGGGILISSSSSSNRGGTVEDRHVRKRCLFCMIADRSFPPSILVAIGVMSCFTRYQTTLDGNVRNA